MSLRMLLALTAALLAGPVRAEVHVDFISPDRTVPVFGETLFAVAVEADTPVERVEFLVDGSLVRTLQAPPWEVTVDVGQDNVEHHFRAVAHTVRGEKGASTLSTPRFSVNEEVDVALQELYVTVSRGERRILDLGVGDFRVFDDGKSQEMVTFQRGDVPLTAVLLVDASESMQGERLHAALDGVDAFVSGMRPLDEAMVMLFSDTLLRATPFTDETAVLARSLAGVAATGGTALNDHLYLALKKLDARPGRRVVVVLSDGADVLSVLRMRDVLWKARLSRALVYWIRLDAGGKSSASFSSAWRDADANREELALLEKVVAESGGRVVGLRSAAEVPSAFALVLRELREQYVLGYYPSDRRGDGRLRPVEVRVGGMGLSVRSLRGWYDY
ncbi:MAG TPA: VWA domain-containing protein [Thermoanaerobaculia bacterium]|nr:VWA domain-containing protein [Thermoanaerobaculia bacterium]